MQIFVCKHLAVLQFMCKIAGEPKQRLNPEAAGQNLLQKAVRIMKITAVILLIGCLHVNAAGYSQKISLSEKEVSIEKIFKEIKKQTGYKFLYNSSVLDGTKSVTINVKSATVAEVLELCLKGQSLEYKIKTDDKIIIIKRKEFITDSDGVNEISDRYIDVRGVIIDENGSPAQGVNVVVKGTNKGTTTNLKGEFVIGDIDERAILVISSVGYNRQEIPVKNQTFISTQLRIAVGNLDEMQVIAYGTTSRRFSTGNVSTVKSVDIEKQPVQNPLLALQGRVTGIEITQLTGLPGGAVQARIQGLNSIRSGLDPLVVIDGVPFPTQLSNSADLEGIVQYGSPLNYINSNDIESIDILKDADATGIYGSRAANGAILITTKKGKAGKIKLTINLQQGWGKVARKVKMMNTRQYLDMRYEALDLSGTDWRDPSYSANDLKVWDTTRYTDWQKELIGGTAKYTDISTSISGGTPAVQYLIGANYKRQTSVFPGDFDDKVAGLHFNISASSPNQKLKVQLTGSYTYDQNRLPGTDLTQQAVLFEPNAPATYKDGALNWEPDATGGSTWQNPLAYTLSTEFNNTTKNMIANGSINYNLFRGFTISSNFGYTNTLSDLYLPSRLEATPPESRPYAQRYAQYANRNMSSWIIEPQLRYEGKIGKGKIEGLVGSTIQKSNFNYLSIYGSGFATDLLMKSFTAAPTSGIYMSTSGTNRFNAIFGRLSYIWDAKYLLNLTARRDGSNKFGDNNKFHNFGSIGLGWIFTEEKFIDKHLPFLSFGKLRGSYGTTGNDQIADFRYLGLYYINNPTILYQNNIGLTAQNIPNPYLQWEETKKLQVGIDLGFFKDRILLAATYARNRSSNLLINYLIPDFNGFSSIDKNLGATIQNTSFELMLNTINVRRKDFEWRSTITLTVPKNKVVNFPGIENTPYAKNYAGIIVGEPIGVTTVYKYGGVDINNGVYQALTKDGIPTQDPKQEDKTILISTLTTHYGGFLNSLTYKSFQFEFLFQFVRRKSLKDMYYYNGRYYPGDFSSGYSNQPASLAESKTWNKAGEDAKFAKYSPFDLGMTVMGSDEAYSYDASYIRLKNVSVSWQVPMKRVKKVMVQNASIFFRGQNLATITNYSGLDPETNSISSLPPLKLWTIGVQLGF